jgi:flagellar biosynthesis protein FlhF
MSTTTLDETPALIAAEPVDAPATTPVAAAPADAAIPADGELRTYRGKTLEELLPRIREELGPDAIVVRQRDGLMGGIGGFFQQRFVEVEARVGGPRIDVYDDVPTSPESFAALLAAAEEDAEPIVTATAAAPEPAPATIVETIPSSVAQPAAPRAAKAKAAAKPKDVAARKAPTRKPAARKAPLSAPRARRAPAGAPTSARARALATELTGRGLSESFAHELIGDAGANVLPFTPNGDLRDAIRGTLARRLPAVPLAPPAGRVVAFVGAGGAGKTRCVAGLAAAHAQAGTLPVVVLALGSDDGGAALTRLLKPHRVAVEAPATPAATRSRLAKLRKAALVVLDTPAVSPGDGRAIADLAKRLAALGLEETQLVVPATLSAVSARELHERLAPLRPTALAMTHADATDHVGTVVELACATGLPLAYVADGIALPGALAPADPARMAERLLP